MVVKVSEKFGIQFEVYSIEELKSMTRELCKKVKEDKYEPSVLIGLGRGGWPILRYCSDFLGIDRTYTMRVEYILQGNSIKIGWDR